MKKIFRFMLISIIAVSFIIVTSCDKDDDEEAKKSPGTLTVSISGATDFDGHRVIYSIYDSKEMTNFAPSGNMIGKGYFTVTGGTGSFVTLDATTEEAKTFDGGTYYMGAIADLDDSIVISGSMDQTPTNPDKVMGGLKEIVISGDTTVALTAADFPLTGEQVLNYMGGSTR